MMMLSNNPQSTHHEERSHVQPLHNHVPMPHPPKDQDIKGFHRQDALQSKHVAGNETHSLKVLETHEDLWKQWSLEHLLKECVLNESLASKLQQKLQASTHTADAQTQSTQEQNAIAKQIEELCEVYSFQQALNVFGIRRDENHMLYDSLAETLNTMMGSASCTLLHEAMHSYEAHMFQLVGHSTHGVKSREEKAFSTTFKPENAATSPVVILASELPIHYKEVQWALYQGEPVELVAHHVPDILSGLDIVEHPARHWLLVPVKCYQKGHLSALLLFEAQETYVFRKEQVLFGKACGALYQLAQALQMLVKDAQQTVEAYHAQKLPSPHQETLLLNTRSRLTELVSEFTIEQQNFAEALAAWVDARERHTQGYSQQVANVALNLGKHLTLNEKTLELLYFAGLLGNVGRFSIPTELLRKKDTLTSEDWATIEQHPNIGVHLLMQMSFLTDIVPFIHHQRERWDGTGHPHRLSGWDIPLGSRILGLAGAFVALLQPRRYRPAPALALNAQTSAPPLVEGYHVKEALAILQKEAGTKWDPELVALLHAVVVQTETV
ncbi:MAG: HD-GYP domain-containing protein [Vampirovibrionales bacterium]